MSFMDDLKIILPLGLTYPSSCSFAFIGRITKMSKIPSNKQTNAKIMKGMALPQNSYKNPPKGGATRHPKLIKAKAIPNALDLSDSSVYRSAIIDKPPVSANADPTPWRKNEIGLTCLICWK